MMETICIIACVALVIWGIVIMNDTKTDTPSGSSGSGAGRKGGTTPRSSEPPPLPPRNNIGSGLSSVSSGNLNYANGAAASSLPHRRPVLPKANKQAGDNCGPRGIEPTKYPRCPYCRQRNIKGEKQLIYWNHKEQYYHCSRGHRFRSNGSPL